MGSTSNSKIILYKNCEFRDFCLSCAPGMSLAKQSK